MKKNLRPDESWAFAELQADYGAYHFPELALQRIWRDLQFDLARLVTADGRPVEVLDPGTWNRLGGPDFRGACIRLGNERVRGDVEVHVHASDWRAHGHDRDPGYADVILHLVLFPVPPGATTCGFGERSIPIAALLDLIPEDLESYAAAFALEANLGRQVFTPIAAWQTLPASDREAHIRAAAARRWQRKVADAAKRVALLGWRDACHTAALEVLGYSRNRLAMLRVATEWPLERWQLEHPTAGELMSGQAGSWSRQGVRPGNRPAVRLRQYARWVDADPLWPDRLRETELPPEALDRGDPWHFWEPGQDLRRWFKDQLCAGAVRGRRSDTLVCDAFLPLLATLTSADLDSIWMAWPAGDIPRAVGEVLAGSVSRPRTRRPVPNGWVQGIWGCLQEAEVERAGAIAGGS